MKLYWHPSCLANDDDATVRFFIRKDLARYRTLRLKVLAFLKLVEPMHDLEPLQDTEQIASLGSGLFEMRIPKTAKDGVVRIYFCYDNEDPKALVLLTAELKHDKAASKIESARKLYRLYHESDKGLSDGPKRQ